MRPADQILWTLDNSIAPAEFERLCTDLLSREGYRHIVPVGGTKDHGRDAEVSYFLGTSVGQRITAFQFSLHKQWEAKLIRDASTIAEHRSDVAALVFVTTQSVTGAKQDTLALEIRDRHGWDLTIYSREWFRQRLGELHHDLAETYLGVSLAPTVGYAATQFELVALDDYANEELFRNTPHEVLRGILAARAQKEPQDPNHWYQLARIEYLLRDYEGALRAVDRALRLNPEDELLLLNIHLFYSTLLAEKGIQEGSRPLLIRARDLLTATLPGKKRPADHYNLANILGALGQVADAKKEYLACLALEPTNAKAWKNLGSLLAKEGHYAASLEAFETALQHQPNMVEAHLCKATTYLIAYNNAPEAIKHFTIAARTLPTVHERWPYIGYWFSKALSTVGQDEDALTELEKELALRPDNRYLLDQKLELLIRLRRGKAAYGDKLLDFLQFRVDAIPYDFGGLAELIAFEKQIGADAVWNLIDRNLPSEPFPVSRLAREAGILLSDFESGFRYAKLYATFRAKFSTEDYCVSLQSHGLRPSSTTIAVLDFLLMAPFGSAASALNSPSAQEDDALLNAIALGALNTISSIFPLIGSRWLRSERPESPTDQRRLLVLGMCFLPDVVVAETARQIAFLKGIFQIPDLELFATKKPNWAENAAEVAVRLMKEVVEEWNMGNDERT